MREPFVKLLMVVALTGVAGAQQRDYQPSCTMCPGTFIDKAELDAYLKRGRDNDITDQQVRQVDIGKSHLGLGMIQRERRTTADAVAEHDLVSEVYHIIEGRATL